jgi:pyridoxal phosphate enzyme (YggS family)
MDGLMTDIAARIRQVKDKIAAACARTGRQTSEVSLVIVTKSASLEQIKEVLELGRLDLGENRVQQLKKVYEETHASLASPNASSRPAKINWHMIGHLQRNKVRMVLPIVTMIHSVDTLRLAEEISTAAAKLQIMPSILLQVNASSEPQKYGVPVGAAIHLAEQIETLPCVRLCGLMTLGPLTHDVEAIRACFARMRELFLEIKASRVVGPKFDQLSMGMSHDYEIAIEEGATILRIGSAIFAPS